MFKKFTSLVLAFVVIAGLMSGCASAPIQKVGMVKQLNDKNVGVITGTVADVLVLSLAKNAKIAYFANLEEAVKALKEGKIDAVVYDEPILKSIAAKNEDLTILKELITNESYAFAVKPENKDLLKKINNVIDILKKDSTYDEMIVRWMPEMGNPGQMPNILLSGTNGILTFGTATDMQPFAYLEDGQYVGFDIELAKRVAKAMDMDLKVVNMEFDKLIPALLAGDVDFIGAGLRITEEQAKSISFSKPTYEGGNAVLVKKQ